VNTLLVCVSVSHGNTREVAEVIAEVLGGDVRAPDEVGPEALDAADVLGLGSGVFHGRHHPALTGFVARLPPGDGKPVFLFATSGMPELRAWPFTRRLRRRLVEKGYRVVASFSCRGFDTWRPLRLVGGLNKGRPDAIDLAGARAFALELRRRLGG
jgi:flavodoxin